MLLVSRVTPAQVAEALHACRTVPNTYCLLSSPPKRTRLSHIDVDMHQEATARQSWHSFAAACTACRPTSKRCCMHSLAILRC